MHLGLLLVILTLTLSTAKGRGRIPAFLWDGCYKIKQNQPPGQQIIRTTTPRSAKDCPLVALVPAIDPQWVRLASKISVRQSAQ